MEEPSTSFIFMDDLNYIIVLCNATTKKIEKEFSYDNSFYYYDGWRSTLKKFIWNMFVSNKTLKWTNVLKLTTNLFETCQICFLLKKRQNMQIYVILIFVFKFVMSWNKFLFYFYYYIAIIKEYANETSPENNLRPLT